MSFVTTRTELIGIMNVLFAEPLPPEVADDMGSRRLYDLRQRVVGPLTNALVSFRKDRAKFPTPNDWARDTLETLIRTAPDPWLLFGGELDGLRIAIQHVKWLDGDILVSLANEKNAKRRFRRRPVHVAIEGNPCVL